MTTRPSWDEYFMSLARLAATRSTCVRRRVGAVIVKDRMVLSTGYNDTPRGMTNCGDGRMRAVPVRRRARDGARYVPVPARGAERDRAGRVPRRRHRRAG